MQNVFLKICTRFESLREPNKLRSWLYRIAANAAIDYYRAKKIEVQLSEEIEWAKPSETIDKHECFQESQTCLVPLINALPAKYQAAVTLTELEGWTNKRFGASIGISLSGVKSRVQRGRKKRLKAFFNRFEVSVEVNHLFSFSFISFILKYLNQSFVSGFCGKSESRCLT